MNKKSLIILIAVIVIILLAGAGVYLYFQAPAPSVENSAGGAETTQKEEKEGVVDGQNKASENQQYDAQIGGIKVEGGNSGGLTVCSDRCGDGVCQQADPDCGAGNNLNCVCPETKDDCPQDCK